MPSCLGKSMKSAEQRSNYADNTKIKSIFMLRCYGKEIGNNVQYL